MDRKLETRIRFYTAPKSEKEKFLASERFIKDAGLTETQRKYLLSVSAEEAGEILVREAIYDKVMEGADYVKLFRDIVPVFKSPSFGLRFFKRAYRRYAPKIAELSAFPDTSESGEYVDIKTDKYGEAPAISEEMIKMGLWDMVSLEIKRASQAVENTLNKVTLKAMVDGFTGISPVTPSTSFGLSDVVTVRKLIFKNQYIPDTLVLHPTGEASLINENNLLYAAYAGDNKVLRTGQLPPILGMKTYTYNGVDDEDAPKWDDTNSGSDYIAVAFDSQLPSVAIAMNEDLTITEWKEPLYDLHRVKVKAVFGAGVIWDDAGAFIHYV